VQEVTVLNVFRDIATVMVRSAPFVEYLHLARFGERWLIVNAPYYVLA
jgi:Putative lumazine-binding